jgi:hypothetical protein
MPINQVDVSKFLGVQIDSKLNWKPHIDYVCKKLSKSAGIIYKARQAFNKSTLLNLYYTFAYPYYIYCNEVWGSASQTHLNRLLKTQKRLLRIISFSEHRAHTALIFKQFNVLNINQINNYLTGIFMYRYRSGDLPVVFNNMFICNTNIHSYSTRQSSHYHLPQCRTGCFKRSIRYRGGYVWNMLPDNIKEVSSLFQFKKLLKKMAYM